MANVTIGLLSPAEHVSALRLAARGNSISESDALVAGVLASVADRDDFLLLAAWDNCVDGTLRAAVLAQVLAGRAAAVWAPQGIAELPVDEARLVAHRLVAAVGEELTARGIHLAQVVAELGAPPPDEFWQGAGYRHAGDLLYLSIPVSAAPGPRPTLPFSLKAAAGDDPRLASILAETYRGSLDCPLVDGLREPADVLAGYRTVGTYRPQWWLIVRAAGQDAGCLILADHPAEGHAELVYLGITPPFRGRGWGRLLTAEAVALAAEASRERLVIAVDALNHPARVQYAAAGGTVWDTRRIWVRDLRNPQVLL